MIAILCPNWPVVEMFEKRLDESVKEVDGPLRMRVGYLDGREIYVISTRGYRGMSYAAGRLLARRGINAFLQLTVAEVTPSAFQELDIRPGDALPVASIWDLSGLHAVSTLMPNLATSVCLDINDKLPKAPIWKDHHADPDAPHLGTTTKQIQSTLLANTIDKELNISLFDREAAGIAQAAKDDQVSLQTIAIVRQLSSATSPDFEMPPMREEALIERVVNTLTRTASY